MTLEETAKEILYLEARKRELEKAKTVIAEYEAEFGELPTEEENPEELKEKLKAVSEYFKN